jgi:hypothetical protein
MKASCEDIEVLIAVDTAEMIGNHGNMNIGIRNKRGGNREEQCSASTVKAQNGWEKWR